MVINGIERHFLRTTGATIQIAKLCPDEDLSKIEALFSEKSTAKMYDNIITMAVIFNEGYEGREAMMNGTVADPLKRDELLTLTDKEFAELQDEVLKAWSGEVPTIQTKAKGKKKEVNSTSAGSSTTDTD